MSLEDSRCIESHPDGRVRIKALNALSERYQTALPRGKIKDILDDLEEYVTSVATAKNLPIPERNAFANVRGLWNEVIVAVTAWNYRIARRLPDTLFVKLPDVRTMNFRHLFDHETRQLLQDLEDSLQDANVRLITSNPDMLVIRQSGLLEADLDQPLDSLSEENIRLLTGLYNRLEGRCAWHSICAGIGLKTSFRPDRRLQLVHEGNVLKTIFAHLRMRHWRSGVRFHYYGAVTGSTSTADDDALSNAATHTILFVDSIPEPAVDGVFPLRTVSDIERMLSRVLEDLDRAVQGGRGRSPGLLL